jgi:hypothetical protein
MLDLPGKPWLLGFRGLFHPVHNNRRSTQKTPFASLATAAIEPILEFLEVAASTLIFTISAGGGSHATPLEILGLTLFGVGLIICKSVINLSTK